MKQVYTISSRHAKLLIARGLGIPFEEVEIMWTTNLNGEVLAADIIAPAPCEALEALIENEKYRFPRAQPSQQPSGKLTDSRGDDKS